MTRRLLAAGLACAICLGGAIAASQRSAVGDVGRRAEVALLAERRAARPRDLRVRFGGAPPLALRAERAAPAQRDPVQGDERAAAGARARAAQDRSQRERLPDGDRRSWSSRTCCRSSKGRSAGSRAIPRLTRSRSSARRATRRRGAGGSKGITSRSASTSSTAQMTASSPAFFGSNPAEVREGPGAEGQARARRRGGRRSRAARRAEPGTADDGDRASPRRRTTS